jgi:hypothetical protein
MRVETELGFLCRSDLCDWSAGDPSPFPPSILGWRAAEPAAEGRQEGTGGVKGQRSREFGI